MDRLTLKATIISKTKAPNWGSACNTIQDVAEKVLSKKAWNRVNKAAYADYEMCEGSDFVVFNGAYYDWKRFDVDKLKIISSFLDYFNNNELELINNNL